MRRCMRYLSVPGRIAAARRAEALYELSGCNMDKLTELRRTYLWIQEVRERGDLDTLEKVRRWNEGWERLRRFG